MRKRKRGRKFNRERDQRRALLNGLINSLILKEKIKTTEAKAKEISGMTEKFITIAKSVYPTGSTITIAKKADLASIKRLNQFFNPKTAKKLVNEIAPRYTARHGGYTRIIKLGPRNSDSAKMAFIELIK